MASERAEPPARGVIHTPPGTQHGRVAAAPSVADYIEHYWWASWELDQPRQTEVLSYPSVHAVFERGEARIVGVVRARFVRTLEGRSEVLGVKFRPGMFRPLSERAVTELTDREIPLGTELGTPDLPARVSRARSRDAQIRVIEARLIEHLPKPPAKAVLARDLTEHVRNTQELLTVSALSAESGLSERALQRLFREFVGVSPKWVVRRFRLQEAAERLVLGQQSVAALAAALGYFDQAHFTRDFRAVVGRTPVQFLREARAVRDAR